MFVLHGWGKRARRVVGNYDRESLGGKKSPVAGAAVIL